MLDKHGVAGRGPDSGVVAGHAGLFEAGVGDQRAGGLLAAGGVLAERQLRAAVGLGDLRCDGGQNGHRDGGERAVAALHANPPEVQKTAPPLRAQRTLPDEKPAMNLLFVIRPRQSVKRTPRRTAARTARTTLSVRSSSSPG